MTNEEVLKKAMQKARDNGWSKGDGWFSIDHAQAHDFMIIFSHDFAKSFWKQQGLPTEMGDYEWQIRLKEMVLEENPIKYLEQFLA